jgi:predicted  nucleic acid-binding Zn-ribbon protein
METAMINYRGEDLDLRTPQTWTATSVETDPLRGRSLLQQGSARNGPIWVDDIVLAVCNHAFDVALAHRSGEVRLEHVLHALTRVDPAADVLEAHGVRVGPLRRDTATVIASEIPIGLTNGQTMPRRSDELEDVLRTASGNAARLSAPASVADVLYVLADAMPEISALHHINRPAARAANGYAEVTQSMARSPYTFDPVESRYRTYTSEPRTYTSSEPRTYTSEPVAQRSTVRTEFSATPVDSLQNSRLDALEQMMRAIGTDLQNERKVFSSVLNDLQREIGDHRNDTARLSSSMSSERYPSGLSERLQSLENAVINIRPSQGADLGPVFDRLAVLERSLQSSMQAVATRASTGGTDLTPVFDRLAVLERSLHAGLQNMSTRAATGNVDLTPVFDRLAAVERSLQASVNTLSQRAVSAGVDLSPVIERLEIIEEAVLTREDAPSANYDGRFNALSEQLAAERKRSADAQASLLAEMKAIASGMANDVGQRFERQKNELAVSINTLATAVEGQDTDFAGVVTRMEALEKASSAAQQNTQALLQQTGQATTAVQQAHAQELAEVHDALMKLNSNQHTLAGSIEQWRRDGQTSLTTITERIDGVSGNMNGFASRFTGLEKAVSSPNDALAALSNTVDNMHRVTVQRYYRRNRFFYWLFGTDDWVATSWPSQAERISEELRAVKSGRIA